MKSTAALFFVLFWLILCADCMLILNQADDDYRYYTKPLLVPILYIWMFVQTPNSTHKVSKIFVSLALLFCLLGDLFLININPGSFSWGVLCFGIAQVCFGVFFYRLKKFAPKRLPFLILTGAITVAYFVLAISYLWNRIYDANLAIPAIVYSVALSFMLLTAFHAINGKRVKKLALWYFIPGAVLFVASDSLLLATKVYSVDSPLDVITILNIIVMITYGVAIYLFVAGATKFIKS